MADEPETVESATSDDERASSADLDKRVSAVESKLDLILEKLSGSSGQGTAVEPPVEHGSIAEQIRAQLAERDKASADQASADAAEQRVKTIEDRLEGMAERTPQPPERRIERIMWGTR